MAVNRETIRISSGIRVTVTGHVDGATRRLVQAWARTWDEIGGEWRSVIGDLIAGSTDGRWPRPETIAQAERVHKALEMTREEIYNLADLGGVFVTAATEEILALEDEWQRFLIASQYPQVAGDTASVAARLNRIDQNALGAIVERTTERIESYRVPLSNDAVDAMRRELVRGVALGSNPRVAAARMLDRVEGRFNGGLTRALNISRTEILDAHRSAAAVADFANADVLEGWLWVAELGPRTCVSCWVQHGTLHPIEEEGPKDHQQGRCARVPKTKSWADLGFGDIEEPPSLLQDAKARFDSLPEAEQLEVMGPVRLHAYQTGALDWDEMSQRRKTKGWRDSFVPPPVWYARQSMVYSVGEAGSGSPETATNRAPQSSHL